MTEATMPRHPTTIRLEVERAFADHRLVEYSIWEIEALERKLTEEQQEHKATLSLAREAREEIERLNGVISDATKSLAESAAREAAYAAHHCESEGCAHEGEYTAKAALWADKYHRYQTALRHIAITEDADCALAKNPQAMTQLAREALK